MSLLVSDHGGLKTYVVVDPRAKEVVAAFSWAREASRGLKELQEDRGDDLTLHNITHPKCPDWLKEFVRSDRTYCKRRAEHLDARAAAIRRNASELIVEAEGYERHASEWRQLSETVSPPTEPSI